MGERPWRERGRAREVLPPRDAQVLATLTVLSWAIVPMAMHAAAHPRALGLLPAWIDPPLLAPEESMLD